MKSKIIGMISSYPNLNQADWLWKQTPQPFGYWQQIQMLATASEPDYLLLYQFDRPVSMTSSLWWQWWHKSSLKQPSENVVDFRGVPKERIIDLLREPPLDAKVIAINQENYHWANRHCGYVSGPDDAAPYPDYMPAIWYLNVSFRELNEMSSPLKVKTCSWITSGINRSLNHQQRLNFMSLLQAQNLDVDIYGRNLPTEIKSEGNVNNKWNVMSPYYYNLAVENYVGNQWYVSEKLWDALLAWCLPIYYGGTAADRLLPPGSFLRLPSLDAKGLGYIQEVTSTLDAWHEAKEAIAEARQIILHRLNLLNWLSDFVRQQR